jgi:hypothetical protein
MSDFRLVLLYIDIAILIYPKNVFFSCYFGKFVFCEVLNFLIVVGHFFIIDYYLNGDFLKYGLNVITQDPEGIDPIGIMINYDCYRLY